MAADLDESVNALRRARDAGGLPHPRHDRLLILRDRAHGGRLNTSQLEAVRGTRHDVVRKMQGQRIRDFYRAAGGVPALVERTGTSGMNFHTMAVRGCLHRKGESQLRAIAEEVGFDLTDDLFTAPVG